MKEPVDLLLVDGAVVTMDAQHKATLIGELLQRFGIGEAALVKQEYVEL